MNSKLFLLKIRQGCALAAILLTTLFGSLVQPAQAQMNVPVYGQRWDPWQWDRLGWSNLIIRDYGCAVTCTAMNLRYLGVSTNPRDLNNWLKNNGGYSGALIIWSRAAQRAPGVRFVGSWNWTTVAANLNTINYYLDRGLPVIAETRMGTHRNYQHFVVLTGRSGATYYMNDPYYGDRTVFNWLYGDPRRWIYGIRVFSR